MKSGIRSTEFWTMVVSTVGAGLLAALVDTPWFAAPLGVATIALPAVYIWGRAILKAEDAKQTDVIPDAWEPMVDRLLDLTHALAGALPTADRDDND